MANAVNGRPSTPRLAATRLEPEEARVLAREAHRALQAASLKEIELPANEAGPQAAPSDAEIERPEFRPPMALLGILDDGREDGEWLRLRADRYVLGRTEGEIRIPHDNMVSSRHAELNRAKDGTHFRWRLEDLQSSNGTFVRIGSTRLVDGHECLIGRGRFRFEAGDHQVDEIPAPSIPAEGTQAWAGGSIKSAIPAFVEISPAGPVKRYPLLNPEYLVGRDPQQCAINRPDDAIMNARHARLFRDREGRWHLENLRSLNGVWLRIERIKLDGNCQFRLGEQIFQFRVP
jgi:hypothetical protein